MKKTKTKRRVFFLIKSKVFKQPISKEWFTNALKKMKKPDIEDTKELDWGKPIGKEVW